MNQFAHHLQHAAIGEPVVSGNLAMFPLYRDDADGDQNNGDGKHTDYLSFDDASEKDWVTITEVDESGSVPTLLLDNRAALPVFLLDGEQLVGAKQNRTVNLSLLIAAGTKTEIPVSCVEAGRWSRRSRKFHSSRHMHYSRGRRDKMAQVNRSLRTNRSRRADQGQVWLSINEKVAALKAGAPTEAMDDVFEHATSHLDDYARALKPKPKQVGAVFAIDGEVSGFDLFADAAHCARYFPKLVGSHALDAMESATGSSATPAAPARASVAAFLKRFDSADEEVHDAISLGQDLRVETAEVVGAGLVWEGAYIHLAGFPKAD